MADMAAMMSMLGMGGDGGDMSALMQLMTGEKGKGGTGKGGWDKGKGDKGGGMGKGKAAMKVASGEKVYCGDIKSYNAEKSHGYIVCQEIAMMSQQDIYAFKNVLEQAGAGPGDKVAFFVHWSSKGQPQASSPMLRLSAGQQGSALKGWFKAGQGDKGHGFISCEVTKEYFGRDVYVNKDLAANFTTGQCVSFAAHLNRDGMPNVSTMEECDESWEPAAADLSTSWVAEEVAQKGKSMGKGKGGGKDKGGSPGWSMGGKGGGKGMDWWGADPWEAMMTGMMMGGWGKGWNDKGKGQSKGKGGGGGGAPASKPKSTGEKYMGTVKSFNSTNNYGFIECEDVKTKYGFDVWVHGGELNGRGIGEQIYFELGLSNKNQPQAMNVQGADGMGLLTDMASAMAAMAGTDEPPEKKQKIDLSAMGVGVI